jgi:2-dehydro-3-deoxygalactonokinase
MSDATLIGLDWGTSSLRAYLYARDGTVLQQLEAPAGIIHVRDGRFREIFEAHCAPWLLRAGALPVIACGMIGSRQGWSEVRYLQTPAGLAEIAGALQRIDAQAGRPFAIVPGVCIRPPGRAPDVMRGEETQVLGALNSFDLRDATLLLPGTHSKWVQVNDRVIRSFSTFMTGELYSVLAEHSMLGRLFPDPPPEFDATAFALGLERSGEEPHSLAALLFSVRAEGLIGGVLPEALPSYLSGILIGSELAAASHDIELDEPVIVVAAEHLIGRYAIALDHFGLPWVAARGAPAASGLWVIARDARLIDA